MPVLVKRILGYFPMNRQVDAENKKSLISAIGRYLVVTAGLYIVMRLLGRVPFLNNLSYHAFRIGIYYMIAGVILGRIQYLGKIEFEDTIYISKDDCKKLWEHRQCKIIIAAVLIILAVLPRKTNIDDTAFWGTSIGVQNDYW